MPIEKADIVAHFTKPLPSVAPLGRPRPGPGQSDRRTHRLQRRLRAAAGHRSGGVDRPAAARRPPRGGLFGRLRRDGRVLAGRSAATRRPAGSSISRARPGACRTPAIALTGWEGVLQGDVPLGAGLVVVGRPRDGHRPGLRRRRQPRLEPRRRWPSSGSGPRTSGSASIAASWTN